MTRTCFAPMRTWRSKPPPISPCWSPRRSGVGTGQRWVDRVGFALGSDGASTNFEAAGIGPGNIVQIRGPNPRSIPPWNPSGWCRPRGTPSP